MRRVLVSLAVLVGGLVVVPDATGTPAPPLGTSPNVSLVGNVPGSYAGLVFQGDHAYATGWGTGVTVFDISDPESPTPAGELPLPHFENEDVDLCGDTLLLTHDRGTRDLGAVLNVIDVAEPTSPALLASLPLGLTGEGRGAGHIANFVNHTCTQVWVDGGDDVEVVDLTDRAAPKSLGAFRSFAATGPNPKEPGAFVVTHDTERDRWGTLWSVGGGGVAGYHLTNDPLKPKLVTDSGAAGVNVDYDGNGASKVNDFILHNSKRLNSKTLLVTEEDYVDTEGGDTDHPGSCNGQGKFETWSITRGAGGLKPIDTWMTELNSADSKAPVTANCSSHWFEERGGIAAVGWYEQGVRFLDVRNPADIRQIGYYLPADGSTWGAYWVPGRPDLVYTADVFRGIDVLKISNAADPKAATVRAPILSSWFGSPGTASKVPGFTPSPAFGWSCAIPESALLD